MAPEYELRAKRLEDEPFLAELFEATRAEMFAAMGLPAES